MVAETENLGRVLEANISEVAGGALEGLLDVVEAHVGLVAVRLLEVPVATWK